MIDTFERKKKKRERESATWNTRDSSINKRKRGDRSRRQGRRDAYGSVQGVGVQVPRKVLAVPPSGEGEPQCRRDAKVKRVAARQERISGARGLGHSPLPCTVERTGVIARH